MTAEFDYDKRQVIQALRYHFISRIELRLMIILVNVFALLSLVLYLFGKISPDAFIINALLWMALMISVWFILPTVIYRKSETFRHHFTVYFDLDDFTLEHEKGKRSWPYSALHSYKESPNFFHLYFDARSFLLVPKNGFKDPGDISRVRSLLISKLSR